VRTASRMHTIVSGAMAPESTMAGGQHVVVWGAAGAAAVDRREIVLPDGDHGDAVTAAAGKSRRS
jgi:hypothetical protein